MKTITKQTVLSEHLNRHGSLFGGQMMAWMDLAAAICANEIMNMNSVTIAVDRIEFLKAVYLGDVVTFEVEEKTRGRTSLTLHVAVYKSNVDEKMVEVARSNFKFVAIGDNGRPSNEWNDRLHVRALP
ncbi:MAG: acyl-CoA thioesterase [candidate division Zixibacteria bacterium]|nr:acyl-CoA thioesterase [candidate division Zixibacteria bacterium]